MQNSEKMTVRELEDLLFNEEEVRVVFRLPKDTLITRYPYRNNFSDTSTVLQLKERIEKTYPNVDFEIIDGSGIMQHMRTRKLGAVRETYVK